MWAVSEKTNVETEHLIYPLSSLVPKKNNAAVSKMGLLVDFQVADFGGTLSLFLGVSFFTILDNLHLVTKVFRTVFNGKADNPQTVQLSEEPKRAWE